MATACLGRWVIVASIFQIVLLSTVDSLVHSCSSNRPGAPSCDGHCYLDLSSDVWECCDKLCKPNISGIRNRSCKTIDACRKMDGGWGSWGPWTTCNATCSSIGFRERYQNCDNPVPKIELYGLDCVGEVVEYGECKLHPAATKVCKALQEEIKDLYTGVYIHSGVTILLVLVFGIILIVLLYRFRNQRTGKPVEETGSNEALLNEEQSEADSRRDSWANPNEDAGHAGFPRATIIAMETNSLVSGHVPIVRIDSDSAPSFLAEVGASSSETDLGESRFDLYGSRNDVDGSRINLSASDGDVSISTNYSTAPKPVQDHSEGSFVIGKMPLYPLLSA